MPAAIGNKEQAETVAMMRNAYGKVDVAIDEYSDGDLVFEFVEDGVMRSGFIGTDGVCIWMG